VSDLGTLVIALNYDVVVALSEEQELADTEASSEMDVWQQRFEINELRILPQYDFEWYRE
jgi:hypothetical protein